MPVPPPEGASVGCTATTGVTDGGACAGFGPGEPPRGAGSALGAEEVSRARLGSDLTGGEGAGGRSSVKASNC